MYTLKQAVQQLTDHRNKYNSNDTIKYDFEKQIVSAIGKRNFLYLCNSVERKIDEQKRKLILVSQETGSNSEQNNIYK